MPENITFKLAGGMEVRLPVEAVHAAPEPENFFHDLGEYRRLTLTGAGFSRGARHMYDSTAAMVDESLPVDDWLLAHGMGVDRENILVGKLALYGGLVLVAAIFLPGWVLVGVMLVGLGSAALRYGKGFYDYRLSQTPIQQQLAVEKGEEAFAEAAVGSALLGISQGVPLLANARWITVPNDVAQMVQRIARALCLADDPYFIQLSARQGAALASLP